MCKGGSGDDQWKEMMCVCVCTLGLQFKCFHFEDDDSFDEIHKHVYETHKHDVGQYDYQSQDCGPFQDQLQVL